MNLATWSIWCLGFISLFPINILQEEKTRSNEHGSPKLKM